MKRIEIENHEFQLTATSFSVDIYNLKLDDSCILNVCFYDDNKNQIRAVPLVLAGDDYNLWVDDEYIYKYVIDKLNLKVK